MKITPSQFNLAFLEELDLQIQDASERPEEIDLREILSSDLISPVDVEEYQTELAGVKDHSWENDRWHLVCLIHVEKFQSFLKIIRFVCSVSFISNDVVIDKHDDQNILLIADLGV